MFQLRNDHIGAFEETALSNFEERGVAHLRKYMTDRVSGLSDRQLRLRIRNCVSRASSYGLTTEKQVMYFVDSTYLAGERFDTEPAGEGARNALCNQALPADSKAILTLLAAREMAMA